MIEQQTREEQIKCFLEDKNLLDNTVEVVQSTGIVGEEIPIKAETIVCTGKKVINKSDTSTNLHPEDRSGVGKDFVTEGVMKIVFHKDWERYDIPSPTAITYGQRKQEVTVNKKKMFKRERREITEDTILYAKDTSQNFLNGDDAKILFEGNVDITRTIDGKSCRIQWKKPVIIVTTAETDTKHQQLRRIPSLPLNSTAEQTKKIVDKQWNNGKNIIMQQNDIHAVHENQEIAKESFYRLKKVFVDTTEITEYAREKLPKHNSVAMRTLNKRLMDYIKFSTGLYQYQRKQLGIIKHSDRNEYAVIEATKQDVDIGYTIFNYIYQTEFADISFLNKRQRRIRERLKSSPDERFSASVINIWEESEGVTRRQTYADLVAIARADQHIKYDEATYPKGFYFTGNIEYFDKEKNVDRLKGLKEFCKENYDKDKTISYETLTNKFPEQFIGEAIQSGLLTKQDNNQYHYEEGAE